MDDYPNTKKPKLDKKRQRPNWFLAFQFDNPDILTKVKNMQNDVIEVEPKLTNACVPVEKSHMTLFVLDTDNIEKVIEIVSNVIDNHEFNDERPNETCIDVNGTGDFRNEVVFAKMTLSLKLEDLVQKIGTALTDTESTITVVNDYKPHLTVMKLSRMDFKEKKKNKIRKIPGELYADKWQNQHFGSQKINSVQLLSMTKPVQENGYYFCQHTFPLKFIQQDQNHPMPPSPPSHWLLEATTTSNMFLYAVISSATAFVAIACLLQKFKK